LTDLIRLTGGAAWASEAKGDEAACFLFDYGSKSRIQKSVTFIMRALPVRAGVEVSKAIAACGAGLP
jgi:hypothetical protein